MKRTKEEADVTRQKLLQAALFVFSRDGYDASRIDQIAREAGLTRGALYHHFGSKAALYNTLIDEVSARVNQIVQDAIKEDCTTLEVLRRVLIRSLSYATKDSEWQAVNRLRLLGSSADPDIAAGHQRRLMAVRAVIDQVAAGIRGGIEAGEIRADVDPRSAAVHFVSLQNGLLGLWLEDPSLFDLATEAERVADIFIAGITS